MNPSTAAGPRRRRPPCSRPGCARSCSCPGSRNAPLSFAVHDAARAGRLRLHTRIDERTAGFLALGLTKVGAAGRRGVHQRHGGRQPAARRHGGRARRRRPRRGHRRPAGADARHQRQPDHRPGRGLRRLRADDGRRAPAAVARVETRPGGPVHLNVHLDEPLLPEGPWTDARRRRVATGRGPRHAEAGAPGRTPHRRGGRRRRRPARRGCWPRTPGGRCWPSRPAARAPATTPSAPTACCWAATSATASSGSSSPGTRRCRARSPGCSPARTSRSSRCAPAASGGAPLPGRPGGRRLRHDARRPGLARGVARGRPLGGPPARPAAGRRARPHAVRGGGRGQPGAAARRAAARRRLQPDPRPGPDGGALRRGRPAQGDRQPRPRRHRRHRVHRDRRRAGPPAQHPRAGADGRRDLPARHDRLVLGPASSGPTSPSWSSTTTAGRSSACWSRAPTSTPTRFDDPLRDAARRRPGQPLRGHPHPAPAGHQPARARAGARPRPTAASRWSRPSSAATTAATSTPGSGRSGRDLAEGRPEQRRPARSGRCTSPTASSSTTSTPPSPGAEPGVRRVPPHRQVRAAAQPGGDPQRHHGEVAVGDRDDPHRAVLGPRPDLPAAEDRPRAQVGHRPAPRPRGVVDHAARPRSPVGEEGAPGVPGAGRGLADPPVGSVVGDPTRGRSPVTSVPRLQQPRRRHRVADQHVHLRVAARACGPPPSPTSGRRRTGRRRPAGPCARAARRPEPHDPPGRRLVAVHRQRQPAVGGPPRALAVGRWAGGPAAPAPAARRTTRRAPAGRPR